MWTFLFDIDGTLLLTRGAGMAAIERAMVELFDVSDIPKVKLHGQTDYGIVSELFRPFELDVDSNIDSMMRKYWEFLPESLHSREGAVLPGVTELLEILSGREDVALGIITGNTKRSAEIKLQHFGLDRYFDFGGYGDIHADRNDVARAALKSSKETLGSQFDPTRLWMVGDTLNDIRCARAIESRIVAVETGGSDSSELAAAGPDVRMESLSRTDEFLTKVFVDLNA